MKHIIFFTIAIILFVSCESEEGLNTLTMKDGRTISIGNDIKYYQTINDFMSSVSFSFDNANDSYTVDTINYLIGERYKITGYSSDTIEAWEIAKFGNWIEQYGLRANHPYYVATRLIKKYVSQLSNGIMIVPTLNIDSMGYCPGITNPTFIIDKDTNSKFAIFKTGERVIGYDSDGNSIFYYIPNLKTVTWKFSIQDDGWE